MSSSTSNVSESNSVSQNPDEHIPKDEPSDQLKNEGEADQANRRDTEAATGEVDEAKEKKEDEEEEEGECGFCVYMKGGGCRDSFTEWEKCMEEAEKNKEDVVQKCFQITSNLKSCMEAHANYYEPILRAEKAAEAEVTKELERESEKKSEDQSEASDPKN